MFSEIEQGMDGTSVRAGLIKLASSDDGLQEVERKTLRAALRAAAATGAPIASHSPNGAAALEQLGIVEDAGFDPGRFVVVHASSEPDFARHLEIARRGAWVEYDNTGSAPDEDVVDLAARLIEAGYLRQLLMSQDVCGWLVGDPGGGDGRRFAYLVTDFVPRLRAAGVSDGALHTILVENPRRLLAFGGASTVG